MVSEDMKFKPGDRVLADESEEGVVLDCLDHSVVVRMAGPGKYGSGNINWHPTRLTLIEKAGAMPDPVFSLEEITECLR